MSASFKDIPKPIAAVKKLYWYSRLGRIEITEQLFILGKGIVRFSLGGDLIWALSLRNPNIFSGAVVMGSMSTY